MDDRQNDTGPDTMAVYVWLSRDADGIEGILAAPGPNGGLLSLTFTNEDRARRMTPYARLAAHMRGFPAELVKFTRAETITEVPSAG